MATDEYNANSNHNDMYHLRRDARDAHSDSQLAKWLSMLSLLTAAIALAVAMTALSKAGEAQSTANRVSEQTQQVRTQ